ncbi:DUF4404 family protein [Massilia sp. W12]|uniref:DUF4404 family protein n=1 Tax=Massilia sp. W12 TaxID=3126507 RepID=UPI0030CD0C16
MQEEQLKQTLRELHQQLSQTEQLDGELQRLLGVLNDDIEELLEREEEREADENSFGLTRRSQELTAQFAAQHPKLEPVLRELSRLLSNMGI